MDSYEVSEVKGPPRPKRPSARVWNMLTIIDLGCFILCSVVLHPDLS